MMIHFFFIVTYLSKVLIIELEINSIIIALLCALKKIYIVDSIDNKTIIQKFRNMKTCKRKF